MSDFLTSPLKRTVSHHHRSNRPTELFFTLPGVSCTTQYGLWGRCSAGQRFRLLPAGDAQQAAARHHRGCGGKQVSCLLRLQNSSGSDPNPKTESCTSAGSDETTKHHKQNNSKPAEVGPTVGSCSGILRLDPVSGSL